MGYMPVKEDEFLSWSGQFIAVVAKYQAAWQISQEKVARLQALHAAFAELCRVCAAPEARKIDFPAKKAARVELRHEEERLVGQLQTADFMNDDFRTELGITLRSSRRGRRQGPKSVPEIRPVLEPPGGILFRFQAPGARRGAKDPDALGLELRWAFLNHPPSSTEELVYALYAKSRKAKLQFDLPDRGKTLYYMARWQGPRDQHGLWSAVMSVIVP